MEYIKTDREKSQNAQFKVSNEGEKDEECFLSFIQEEADDLSVIGVRHCYDKKRSKVRRGIWVLLVAIGVISATTLIYDRTSHFFQFPVMTTLDIIAAKSLNYPKITICNANQIKKSAAEEYGLVDYFKQFSLPYYINDSVDPIIQGPIPNYTQELRNSLSPGLEQILCYWQNNPCPSKILNITYTTYGRCITVDPSLSNLTIYKAGSSSGLHFILTAFQDDYLVTREIFSGFTMLLHNPLDPARVEEFGLKILLGHENAVSFSILNIIRQSSPYGNCRNMQGYNSQQSEMECIRDHIIETCGCRPISMTGNERECNFYEDRCVNRKSRDEKSCECPSMCDDTIYNPSISTAKFSPLTINEIIIKTDVNTTYEFVLKNYAIVDIYISKMEVTKVTTSPAYSFISLLADIGGALSLMLGATLLTIAEVFEMGINVCMFMGSRRKKKNYESNKVSQNKYQINNDAENNSQVNKGAERF